jgi:hypothetical protein
MLQRDRPPRHREGLPQISSAGLQQDANGSAVQNLSIYFEMRRHVDCSRRRYKSLNLEVHMRQAVDEDLKAYCYRHAEECARRAASQSDARHRQDFLELERRWLTLATDTGVTKHADVGYDNHHW